MTTKGASVRRRAGTVLAAAGTVLAVVAGCVADPPPPTVVGGEEGGGDGTDVSLTAGGLLLTLDRVEEGFNPHLLSDQGVRTRKNLEKAGVEVIPVPYTEIFKLGGGIHCSTLPLLRDHVDMVGDPGPLKA